MKIMIWIAVLAGLAMLVLWLMKRQKSAKSPDLYVCDNCGEKDCDCTKLLNGKGNP